MGIGSDGSDGRDSGAKALSLLLSYPGIFLISSSSPWEVSRWLLAWVAIRGLSTGVTVLSWKFSGQLPLRQIHRSKRGSGVGFLDILIVCKEY